MVNSTHGSRFFSEGGERQACSFIALLLVTVVEAEAKITEAATFALKVVSLLGKDHSLSFAGGKIALAAMDDGKHDLMEELVSFYLTFRDRLNLAESGAAERVAKQISEQLALQSSGDTYEKMYDGSLLGVHSELLSEPPAVPVR